MQHTGSALERTMYVFNKKRTELCRQYYLGVLRLKHSLGAKNDLQDQTWFGLGRHGA
jgi:hypothetical protein